MSGSSVAFLAVLLVWLPAQTRQTSRMAIEVKQDTCAGLSTAECCSQRLELAGFRATGEHVPKGAKTPVRLSCSSDTQVVPEGACRSIALGRGFSAQDVSGVCDATTLSKRCEALDACKTCVADLGKLNFTEPARACYAVTYTAKAVGDGDAVIILKDDKKPTTDGSSFEVRKRRRVVR